MAVLGGGLAGMAAALRLAEAGLAVELFEKRTTLGGRASSFTPPGETEPIDNCQHVLLGCCTNLLDFFQRCGMRNKLRFYNQFSFHDGRNTSMLSASALPAPLHFLPSLLRMRSLTGRERRGIARAMLAIARSPRPYPDAPFLAWLDRQKQSEAAREHFWKVILVSALNEDLERLSTRAAFHVFADSFLRNRRGYRMGIPTVPLGDLYASRVLAEKCNLRLGTAVQCVELSSGRVRRVMLQNGEAVEADCYVSALPPDAAARLLGDEHRSLTQSWSSVEWSPITGVHLWFDRAVMHAPHLTVSGRTIQWLFNKSEIAGKSGPNEEQYVQVVVSASRALLTMKREEILERVMRDLAEVLPPSKQAVLRRAVIVKETEATPSFAPGCDHLRPAADTLALSNFFLAGDWTATGWPPTMESAVRSGYRAAECVAAAAGRPQRFLISDLPADPLARWVVRS